MVKAEEFFNLHDLSQGIRRTLAEGLTTRVFPGDQAMLSVVRIEPNTAGKLHSHPQEQWGLLLEGGGFRMGEDGETQVRPGDFWRTPGDVVHGFRAGSEGALVLDIFSPPREEYRKAGSGYAD